VSTDCEALVPAIAARAAGLPLEDDERRRCEEHLARCGSCPSLANDMEKALAAAALEPRFASDGSWERIAEGIRVERARALASPSLKILLSCTFCHGALDRREAAYCATCLAPHHAECFETHGRCGAAGCDETHTVSPRAPAPPRRRLRAGWIVLGLVVPAAAVAALSTGKLASKAPAGDGVSAVVSGGRTVLLHDAPPPPPYPEEWQPAAPGSPRERLEKTRVSVRFAGTPLGDVIDDLRDATGLPFVVTAGARETIDYDQLKLSLEGTDVRAWDVLAALLEVNDSLSVVCNDHAVRVLYGDNVPVIADPRGLLDAGVWKRSYLSKLRSQSFALRFQAKPISEVVETFRGLTGLRYGISRAVDQEQLKVTFVWPGGSAETALTELLWSVDLDWELQDGMVWIAPRDDVHVFEHRGPSSFSARGVTVPQLVTGLRETYGNREIEFLATKEAWSSRGTVSFVWEPRDDQHGHGADLIAALASQTGLRPSVFRAAVSPRPREVLVIDGEAPGTREALSAVPAPYPAVVREVAELQRSLPGEVEARAAIRRADIDPDVAAEAQQLVAAESAVVRTAGRILDLTRRSKEIAGAKERLGSARSELELARAAVAQREDEVSRLTATLREREAETAKLDALSSRARREQLLEASRVMVLAGPERVELEELVLAERALAGSTSRAVAARREARVALDQARTASFERAARIARLEDEVRSAEADVATAAKLERGEPLDGSR
jgi:hypothetical protein